MTNFLDYIIEKYSISDEYDISLLKNFYNENLYFDVNYMNDISYYTEDILE